MGTHRLPLKLIIAFFVVFSTIPARGEGLLSLATLNWAPYVEKDLPGRGFTTEIVTTVFERAGYRVEISFMPWARVLRRVARGDAHAMYPAYQSKERIHVYAFSDPFARSYLVFYKRVEDDIEYTTLGDLSGYRIGVVRGYVNSPAFDRAGYLQKEATDSDESNLRKLLKGRIDLAVIDRDTAAHLIETRIPGAAGRLVPLDRPLQVKPLYLAVSKNIPGYSTIVADFNRALEEMSSEGLLQAIKERHGIRGP
jgi:polar amino acid transport system substrate-binding protein